MTNVPQIVENQVRKLCAKFQSKIIKTVENSHTQKPDFVVFGGLQHISSEVHEYQNAGYAKAMVRVIQLVILKILYSCSF